MKASIVEMEGLLRGKCVPAKMLLKESLAEYLVRQFDSLHERAEVAERERDELRGKYQEVSGWYAKMKTRMLSAEAELSRGDSVEGEPDYWQFKSVSGDWIGIGESGMRQAVSEGVEVRPLYTAALPAVLPPEMKPEPEKYDVIDHGFIAGYNQCRADAMALGAQQQKVVELPEPVKWPEIPFKYFSEEQVFSMLDAAGVKWEVKK